MAELLSGFAAALDSYGNGSFEATWQHRECASGCWDPQVRSRCGPGRPVRLAQDGDSVRTSPVAQSRACPSGFSRASIIPSPLLGVPVAPVSSFFLPETNDWTLYGVK